MKAEIQNQLWAILPKEARVEVKVAYGIDTKNKHFDNGYNTALIDLFGLHNLTSDTEPEEMLTTSVKKVVERVRYLKAHPKELSVNEANARASELLSFFGDKCLPDKPSNGAIGTTPPAVKLDVKPIRLFESDYNIGDKVIITITSIGEPRKEIVTLIRQYQPQCEYNDYTKTWVVQTQSGMTFQSNEKHFEPYTEENKETIKMKTLEESLPEAGKIIEDNFWDLIDEDKKKEKQELNKIAEEISDGICDEVINQIKVRKNVPTTWHLSDGDLDNLIIDLIIIRDKRRKMNEDINNLLKKLKQ